MSKKFYGGIHIQSAQEIAFYDSDSTNFTALKAPAGLTGDVTLTLPDGDSTGTQALVSNGSGTLSWSSFLDSSLTDGQIYIGNGSNVATGVTPSGDVTITNAGVMAIASGVIVDADVNASAAIGLTKLAATTANRALISDGSGFVSASSVTNTELGYVSGVTSAIQTQIDSLTSTINNFEWQESAKDYVTDNTAVPPSEVSGDRYILSHDGGTPHANYDGAAAGDIVEFDGSVWVAVTPTAGTFIAVDDDASGLYLWGGSSYSFKSFEATTASTGLTKSGFDIQLDSSSAGDGLGFSAGVLSVNVDDSTIETATDALQLKDGGITNAKINASAGIALTKLAATTANRAMVSDASGFLVPSAVTDTEIGYLDGVTSALQTQLDGKASTTLNNLGTTAINASLLVDTDNAYNLGSTSAGLANVYANALRMDANGFTTAIVASPSNAANTTLTMPPDAGTSGYVLSTDGAGVLSWVVNESTSSFSADWVTGDGVSKAITHSLGTKDVIVQIYDKANDATIEVDSAVRTDTNTVTVTASVAPGASGWRVIILKA